MLTTIAMAAIPSVMTTASGIRVVRTRIKGYVQTA